MVKYDGSGNVLWAQQSTMGVSGAFCSCAVSADALGNVYLAGYFAGCPIYFSSGFLSPTQGGPFLVKYNADGVPQWLRSASGTYNYITSAKVDVNGNIIVAGSFVGDLILGTDTLSEDSISTASSIHRMFLAKYDSSGNVFWAKATGGYTLAQSVTTDATGNIYITGEFLALSANDTLIIGPDTLINPGTKELLVAKYSSSGDVVWATSSGGAGYVDVFGIAANTEGTFAYVTGSFYNASLIFGSDDLILPTGYSGQENIFLAKLNTDAGGPGVKPHGNTISLFPNPVTASLTVNASQPINNISIINILGQTVYRQRLSSGSYSLQLDVADLPASVYFIKVNGEAKKFVKE